MRLIDADALWMEVIHTMDYCDDILEIIEHQKTIEPTHLNDSNTLETLDCIGRQEAIEALEETKQSDPFDRYEYHNIGIDWSIDAIKALPSAQAELSENTTSEHPKMNKLGEKTGETCTDTIYRHDAIVAVNIGAFKVDEWVEDFFRYYAEKYGEG